MRRCWRYVPEKSSKPCLATRTRSDSVYPSGLQAEGFKVSMSQLCRWFEVPRSTAYFKPCKATPKVQEQFGKAIKAMIDKDPSFGYRTVAGLLKFNKNTVQSIVQIRGWQVKQRPIGLRPRVEAMQSMEQATDERWATDLCRVWTGRDGWASLSVVIDCYTRELLGCHLSRSAKATTGESALEQALINRYGTLGRVTTPFLLRSVNGLVFTSRSYTRVVKSYGLPQDFITPHCPEQNGRLRGSFERSRSSLSTANGLRRCNMPVG